MSWDLFVFNASGIPTDKPVPPEEEPSGREPQDPDQQSRTTLLLQTFFCPFISSEFTKFSNKFCSYKENECCYIFNTMGMETVAKVDPS